MSEKTITVHLQQQTDYRFNIQFDEGISPLPAMNQRHWGRGLAPRLCKCCAQLLAIA